MDLSILRQHDFSSFVADKLSGISVDYLDKYNIIRNSGKSEPKQLGAGVVLLLNYEATNKDDQPEYSFQLIKRSATIAQAGDISCPGGMLHPFTDKLCNYLLPIIIGQNISSKANNKETQHLIRLFLTNALRESWEEIGLKPWNVRFLGALPCYSLILFARTIFPLVGEIKKPYQFKLSSEVESILSIPLRHFFNSGNYASLKLETPMNIVHPGNHTNFPCIIVPDDNGKEEILWGATFYIVTNFLRLLFGDSLPAPAKTRTIIKVINQDYLLGKH